MGVEGECQPCAFICGFGIAQFKDAGLEVGDVVLLKPKRIGNQMSQKKPQIPHFFVEQARDAILHCDFVVAGHPSERRLSLTAFAEIWKKFEFPELTIGTALLQLQQEGLILAYEAERMVLTDAGFAARTKH